MRVIFFKNGAPLKAGDRLVQKDLANSLRLIARHGSKVFYRGEIGDKIVAEMAQPGAMPDGLPKGAVGLRAAKQHRLPAGLQPHPAVQASFETEARRIDLLDSVKPLQSNMIGQRIHGNEW